jgi:uroporphyrinogen III methyltransferase / synthase
MKVDLPLSQKRIVVTRSADQSESISSELEKFGAQVICVPTIIIEPAALSPADAARIAEFGRYDVVVFTSVNAVKHVARHVDLKKSADGKPFVIAIGRKTAESIRESGIEPDFIPEKFNSVEMMKSLADFDWRGKRVLIPKGSLSMSDVADSVRSHGGTPDEVVVYNTLPNNSIDVKLKQQIIAGGFDVVVFFSPSQIRNFLDVFGAPVLKGKEIAVIGPMSKRAAENLGLSVDVVPENSTTENLVASLVGHEKA